jgi:hypothetical protein
MATTVAIAGVVSALAAAGTSAYAATKGGPTVPKPKPIDMTAFSKAALPGAKADAAARTGGGISPEFIAGLVGQETGQPGGGMDILEQIRKEMGSGGAGAAGTGGISSGI